MEKFDCIVLPEADSRLKPIVPRLRLYAGEVRVYDTDPQSREELIRRVADADCILPMGGTRLDRETISASPNLRYIGLAATLFTGNSSNIDLEATKRRSIPVTGVRDYGDIGVAEWIVSVSVNYLKRPPTNGELAGTPCGIIGAGAAGSLTAKTLRKLDAEVSYFNRSRKPYLEEEDIDYRPLDRLLPDVRILSLHLPRRTKVLGAEELASFGNGKLLINTSVGLPIDEVALRRWLEDEQNVFAADSDGIGELSDICLTHPRLVYLPASSGYTKQAEQRLFEQVEHQLRAFLNRS